MWVRERERYYTLDLENGDFTWGMDMSPDFSWTLVFFLRFLVFLCILNRVLGEPACSFCLSVELELSWFLFPSFYYSFPLFWFSSPPLCVFVKGWENFPLLDLPLNTLAVYNKYHSVTVLHCVLWSILVHFPATCLDMFPCICLPFFNQSLTPKIRSWVWFDQDLM